jgi:hypothetical protein
VTDPNAELAYRVLDQIEAHPELHKQGEWLVKTDCGTAGCFAGWAVMLSGAEPQQLSARAVSDMVLYDGRLRFVPGLARDLLRSECVADEGADGVDLFETYHSLVELRVLVAEIFGPRPAVTA